MANQKQEFIFVVADDAAYMALYLVDVPDATGGWRGYFLAADELALRKLVSEQFDGDTTGAIVTQLSPRLQAAGRAFSEHQLCHVRDDGFIEVTKRWR